jgi:hypothetical protein
VGDCRRGFPDLHVRRCRHRWCHDAAGARLGQREVPTFEAAVTGGEYGASQPFNYTVPAAGSSADAYYLDNLRAFAVIPEPSTIALGILGAASLLFLRRRK